MDRGSGDNARAMNVVLSGVHGHLAQIGSVYGDVHLRVAARPVIALPYRFGPLPQRAAAFRPRTATSELARILEYEIPEHHPVPSPGVRTVVLSGLGGVGKTQIALDYLERSWAAGTVDLVVWVTAGSRDAVVSAYARVAAALSGFEEPDPEVGAHRLLDWLASTTARWLVVLDEVQNPRDLSQLWPPAVGTGRVVATTRRRDAVLRGSNRYQIDIGLFTSDEAQDYLSEVLSGDACPLDRRIDLARALGHLPLALAQAAAYIVDRQLSCAEYVARFSDRRRQLAALFPDPDWLPDEQRATVATTWSLSIEQADRLAPPGLARPLLEVASVLDPNGIPVDVFTDSAVTALLTAASGREVDAEQARDGLACLHRLNLITLGVDPASSTVRVHAMVQRATVDSVPPSRLPALVRAAADALAAIWSHVESDARRSAILRANTAVLADRCNALLWASGAYGVLFRAGTSLGDTGLVTEAREYFFRLSAAAHEQLGPDHPDALATRHSLAQWRGEAGEPAVAVGELEQLLDDRRRVLGEDHPDTLATRHSLAQWRGEAGEPAVAVGELEQLLDDRRRVLGEDHPDTLATRHSLAWLRGEAGTPDAALAAFDGLVEDVLGALGPDHPRTLIIRHDRAYWQGKAGFPSAAAAALEDLAGDVLRVLGPDHPHTLATSRHLAYWHGKAGSPEDAVSALARHLEDVRRVLGPDHPRTLATRHHLASLRGDAGEVAAAAAAFEEVLADRVRVLGSDHPHTLATRHNLAYWRREASLPFTGALIEELLADQARVLGVDHPRTQATRANLKRLKGESDNSQL